AEATRLSRGDGLRESVIARLADSFGHSACSKQRQVIVRCSVTAECLHRIQHCMHKLRRCTAPLCLQQFSKPITSVHLTGWTVSFHQSISKCEERVSLLESAVHRLETSI